MCWQPLLFFFFLFFFGNVILICYHSKFLRGVIGAFSAFLDLSPGTLVICLILPVLLLFTTAPSQLLLVSLSIPARGLTSYFLVRSNCLSDRLAAAETTIQSFFSSWFYLKSFSALFISYVFTVRSGLRTESTCTTQNKQSLSTKLLN